MVRGKARYYNNRPKAVPTKAPGFKELVGLELVVEEISAEEERAIEKEDIKLLEKIIAEQKSNPSPATKEARTPPPLEGGGISHPLTEVIFLPSETKTVVSGGLTTTVSITSSIVHGTSDEQAVDGFGKPANNNKRKKKQ